jgi:hypothetical protein
MKKALKSPQILKYPMDWRRLYLVFLVLFLFILAYGIWFCYSWGEDIMIPPLVLWAIWIVYRMIISWPYTWVQEIKTDTLQSVQFSSPNLLVRGSFTLIYSPYNHSIRKRRIRVRGLGKEAEINLRKAEEILMAKYGPSIGLKTD